MNKVCVNGRFLSSEEPVLLAANRGYRYGDAIFETMKLFEGKILLEEFHFNRLFAGLELMKMNVSGSMTKEKLREEIQSLCRKNDCTGLARVRLSVYRGHGGLFDDPGQAGYIIEAWPLDIIANELNENGLITGIYPDGRKSRDMFSGMKTASFQIYSMAALYAKEQKWNDALVLNSSDRLADSTIANLFLIKEDRIMTPALDEGCVAGVMRAHLLQALKEGGHNVSEARLGPDDLLNADELFLSNAIRGIRWVGRIGEKKYSRDKTVHIYDRFVKTILS